MENTFNLIIKKIINIENNIFSLNYNINDNIDLINKVLFNNYLIDKNNKSYSYKNKFIFIKENLNNKFLKYKANSILNTFCKIQKTYNILNRLVYNYKFKKSKTVVTTDIELNEIKQTDKNIITIYHNNAKFLFKIYDLIKIINNALTNSYIFFAEPLPIKNPYNNIPFDKSILYNIYFYIIKNMDNSFKIKDCILFYKFFICNFNMSTFLNDYEHVLRDYSINYFIKTTDINSLCKNIKSMINTYNINNKKYQIIIHDEFPKNRLVKIMKPYLLLQLKSLYSLIPIIKKNSTNELNHMLRLFHKKNPLFGRKLIKINHIFSNSTTYNLNENITYFNDQYNPININNNFMKDHLNYSVVSEGESEFAEEYDSENESIYDSENESVSETNYDTSDSTNYTV
jgi:hypothetical protein